jgi:uncharacterized protein
MQFDHYTVLLLLRPVDAPELSEEETDALQDAHLSHQAGLAEKGYVIAAGPLVDQDDERLRGIAVLSVDADTARKLYSTDPSVRAGRLETQVMTWLTPAGNVAFESVRHPRSMAEAVG